MRRLLAALAAVPLLTLALGAGTASAAPAHQATAARAAYIVSPNAVRGLCWGADSSVGLFWQNTSPQEAFNNPGQNCGVYNAIAFTVTNCAAPPYQGYCQWVEVSFNAMFGYWSTTGNCVGYNYDLNRLVRQACGNYSYQYWAGTGGSPDLIWSWWLETNYPYVCPVYGGYTQQVITADNDSGPLYLSCPQGVGGAYLGKQSWYVEQPLT